MPSPRSPKLGTEAFWNRHPGWLPAGSRVLTVAVNQLTGETARQRDGETWLRARRGGELAMAGRGVSAHAAARPVVLAGDASVVEERTRSESQLWQMG